MTNNTAQRKQFILIGIVLAWLAGLFLGGFFMPSIWVLTDLGPEVALLLLGTIVIQTIMAAISGYFWRLAGVSGRVSRNMAMLSCLPVFLFFLAHPHLGLPSFGSGEMQQMLTFDRVFFLSIHFLIFRFASLLGVWFGRSSFFV